MEQTEVKINLVIPCFNEAERLSLSYLGQVSSIPGVKLFVVNDGSTDNTLQLISSLEATWSVIDSQLNLGKGEAIRAAFFQIKESLSVSEEPGKEDLVGFLDSDAAVPIESLVNYLRVVQKNDERLAYLASRVSLLGSRIKRTPIRHWLSRIMMTLISLGGSFGYPYDSQCGLKLFRANQQFWKSIREPFRTKWFFDLELLERLHLSGQTTSDWIEIPLTEWTEVEGSKVKLGQVLIDTVKFLQWRRKLTEFGH